MNTKFESDLKSLEFKTIKKDKSLSLTHKSPIPKHLLPNPFSKADVFQQIVGAFIGASPLFLEMGLAEFIIALPLINILVLFLLSFWLSTVILFHTNYHLFKRELVLGIPVRVLSIFLITFTVTLSFIILLGYASLGFQNVLKLLFFVMGFSMLGAATADVVK
ncbi:hypothetical protein J7L02_02255 [Candidatus Woesearchaeota archaeon]|nr:hypothetical protein [Candidatus Woesearchaeota archaeon]